MTDVGYQAGGQGSETIAGRVAALAGMVSFVLILISAILRSNAPSATDTWHFTMASSNWVPCSPPWPCPPRWCGRPGSTAP